MSTYQSGVNQAVSDNRVSSYAAEVTQQVEFRSNSCRLRKGSWGGDWNGRGLLFKAWMKLWQKAFPLIVTQRKQLLNCDEARDQRFILFLYIFNSISMQAACGHTWICWHAEAFGIKSYRSAFQNLLKSPEEISVCNVSLFAAALFTHFLLLSPQSRKLQLCSVNEKTK